jgi:cytochrome b561
MHRTTSPPAPARHPPRTVALHWASAMAIVLTFAVAWSRDAADEKPIRELLLLVHSQLGMLILSMLVLRLWVRLHAHALAINGDARIPAWQRHAAAANHGLLYLLLFAQPLLGWAVMNAQARIVSLFGLLALPALVQADPDIADTLADLHALTGWVLLALIGVHIGAALWHHFIRRDDVLTAMWPVAARNASLQPPRSERTPP